MLQGSSTPLEMPTRQPTLPNPGLPSWRIPTLQRPLANQVWMRRPGLPMKTQQPIIITDLTLFAIDPFAIWPCLLCCLLAIFARVLLFLFFYYKLEPLVMSFVLAP